MTETPEQAATVRRCQRTVIQALTGQCTDDEVAEVAAGLAELPAGHPDRAPIAAGMIMAWSRAGGPKRPQLSTHIADLLPIAEADPPAGEQWEQARAMAKVQALTRGVINGQVTDFADIEAEMAPVLARMADHPSAQPFMSTLTTMAEFCRAFDSGDASTMHNMPGKLGELRGQLDGQPEMAGLVALMDTAAKAMSANQRGEFGEAMRHVEQLRDAVGDRAPNDVLRQVVQDSSAHMARFYQAAGQRPDTEDDPLTALAELENRPDDGSDRMLEYLGLGISLLRAGEETDLSRVDAAVRSHRAALALTAPGDSRHTFALVSLGSALYRRSELAGNTDGLAEAAELLERALALLGGPHHKEWSVANELLATIRHRTGDIRGSGEIGLVAQRGYAWRALMESDAAGAKIAIGDAANTAVDLARRCLYADNPADALRALDSGRGLMLFAATELHKVPARLEAAGRADLARRWAAEGRASSELRREVLAVLAEQREDADKLLDPPSLDEIRAALADLDADALVYLVPAESPQPGLGLIAMADGNLAWMALPNLVLDTSAVASDGVDVEGYLAALADRSRDLAPAGDGRFTDRLDALCDWAWRAAMGPVLDHVLAARPSGDGRVPRVVLVPMGDLARIPWQAARRQDGVYAVELAAFTQAVSARLLCENAARAPVGLSSGGLVVGDPDTGGLAPELEDARLEAHAVRQSFYQGARYVGRRPNGTVSPSGAGTADEVRRWLTDQSPAAGTMLHLACHGSFATGLDDAKSALLLAGDEGELSAEEIVDLLGGAPHRRVGLVVLAACNTGRSAHGFDEAYSLGTAFLAGSACSVLSTQWAIPDAQTPSLMYLFHHYCRREGLPPWQALRQAQMWLLDPDRQPPEGMPAELLRSVPAGEPAPLAAWAGFVHYGH